MIARLYYDFVAFQRSASVHTWALAIAGVFVVIALALSLFLLFQHLTHYNNPKEQKWLVGIIFMVPVYTVESFVSLWNPKISIECDILRNCYEAFALYSFGNYLIECLGGETETIEFLKRQASSSASAPLLQNKEATVQHPFPLNLFLRPWMIEREFFQIAKFGIVQYMILKSFCAFLALLLELFDLYGDGEFKWYYGYPYITVVLNFSQTWALYCLVQFYAVTHEELGHIRPLAKFVCFKSIVFATWWQGVAIALIFSPGFIHGSETFQASLQNFIICIEMAIAAVAHIYIFPAAPYQLFRDYKCIKASYSSGDASMETAVNIEEVHKDEESAVAKTLHTDMDVPGTSLKESMQDVVFGGGEHVVHDVKVTMSQAVQPVGKGITKLNETLHHLSWVDKDDEENTEKGKASVEEATYITEPSSLSVEENDQTILETANENEAPDRNKNITGLVMRERVHHREELSQMEACGTKAKNYV